MAAVSGSQGLFSFLSALAVLVFCFASLPSPLPSVLLRQPLAPRPWRTAAGAALLPRALPRALPLLAEPLHLPPRSGPAVVSQNLGM